MLMIVGALVVADISTHSSPSGVSVYVTRAVSVPG